MNDRFDNSVYYPTSKNPVLFIHSEGSVSVFYDPTYETLLEIESEYGLPANEVEDLIKRMGSDEHTLMIDAEAYLKAKEPSETDILNEKIDKLELENHNLRLELRKMERSTRADILRRIARQLTEEADRIKPLLDGE